MFHSSGSLSGRSTASDFSGGKPFPVQVQQCLLNACLAGARAACDDTELVCQRHFDGFLLLGSKSESQLSFFCGDGILEVIIRWNKTIQLLDNLICQIGFHSCSNAPECTVTIGNQTLILNQFDSTRCQHILR